MIPDELTRGNQEFRRTCNRESVHDLAVNGQHPIAAVVACADSRVPVELIFHQLEPGRLFVIRVAGNIVADASVKGSIEYAVEHLHVPALVILAHTDCGAVKARIRGDASGETAKLCREIDILSKDPVTAVVENLHAQVKRAIALDCVLRGINSGQLDVYGMLYDLESGQVSAISKNGKEDWYNGKEG